jgi:hypothetical protein
MKQIDINELKKKATFVLERAEALQHVIGKREAEFAQTAVGREHQHLTELLKHINVFVQFVKLISIRPDVAGSMASHATYIEGLHNKQDADLLKKLRELQERVGKHELSDWEKWLLYYNLRYKKVKEELNIKEDIHDFVITFNRLLTEATEQRQGSTIFKIDTPVYKAVMSKDKKDIPHILALENHEVIMACWRILMARLYDEKNAKLDSIKHLAMGLDEERQEHIIALIADKTKMPDLMKNTLECLPEPHEDKGLANRTAFPQHLEKCMLLDILKQKGEAAQVKDFLANFKTGGCPPDIALTIHDKFIAPLATDSVKVNAMKEFAGLLHQTIKEMQETLEKEKHELGVALEKRIKDIEHSFARELEDMKKMLSEKQMSCREILIATKAAKNVVQDIADNMVKRNGDLRNAKDICDIMRAELAIWKVAEGRMTEQELDKELATMMAKYESSDRARKVIDWMKAEFRHKMLQEVKNYVYTAVNSTKSTKLPAIDDKIKELAASISEIEAALGETLKAAEPAAAKHDRKLRKIMPHEKVEARPSPAQEQLTAQLAQQQAAQPQQPPELRQETQP